ncbi:helix-turn-helix domain-containing protein [Sphingobium sp. CR2-8]|uniref:helix-turn-helix domain-containing protein n=1 Tax=Sphingobium sp. CR2-8 TaxID=1306534 RepID=UPI002DB8E23A|nr:helix-turn-helix domain-containing protein [Sphingobium sp. CR2-8]MEC3910953.1 helix-turn-helix domain-containing protein [Sphingobium sp. CR2-8]
MELGGRYDVPALLDLSGVEEDRRAHVWSSRTPSIFPGLSISDLGQIQSAGQIHRLAMGEGALWTMRYPAARVQYTPGRWSDDANFTLMMQIEGCNEVVQGRRAEMNAGDICFIDERLPFSINGPDSGQIIFLRMPRASVLSRNPHLEHRTVCPLRSGEADTSMIADALMSALRSAALLGEDRRRAVLVSIIHLMGAAEFAQDEAPSKPVWRVQNALLFIDLHLAEPALSAEAVARSQHISRRHLDQLFHDTLGASITDRIWKRRIEQAAEDLRDPARAGMTISQIAFANGFQDAAHFTNAFRRNRHCTPTQWRACTPLLAVGQPARSV